MISTVLSWLGASLALTAFALNVKKYVTPNSNLYLSLNIIACIFLASASFLTKSYAFVVLNTVWGLVALQTLLAILANKKVEVKV